MDVLRLFNPHKTHLSLSISGLLCSDHCRVSCGLDVLRVYPGAVDASLAGRIQAKRLVYAPAMMVLLARLSRVAIVN